MCATCEIQNSPSVTAACFFPLAPVDPVHSSGNPTSNLRLKGAEGLLGMQVLMV